MPFHLGTVSGDNLDVETDDFLEIVQEALECDEFAFIQANHKSYREGGENPAKGERIFHTIGITDGKGNVYFDTYSEDYRRYVPEEYQSTVGTPHEYHR